MYTRWYASAIKYKKPILVVRYEDVKLNKVIVVENILKFLDFEFTHDIIVNRLSVDFKLFFRVHNNNFDHYTDIQQRKVNKMILRADRFFKSLDAHNLAFLQQYLRV